MARGGLRRFLRIEPPKSPSACPPPTGASLERFGPVPDPPIEILEAPGGPPPSVRCMRCGATSDLFARRCAACDADLDTAAQHAFNEKGWAEAPARAERAVSSARERRMLQERAAAEDGRSSAGAGATAPEGRGLLRRFLDWLREGRPP
ncbi:MAG TPA: hypothetical protein VFI16_10590 [Anaeromyxobacteraceae bacterium]|nr:hypothetical protein [Anaeromyxobacteraceae bacterium]